MTEREVLREVERLLSDKARWTQNCNARDRAKVPVSPTSPKASCWCFNGAYMKVTAEMPQTPAFAHITRASYDLYQHSPAYVNDNLGWEAVLKVLARAKELAVA